MRSFVLAIVLLATAALIRAQDAASGVLLAPIGRNLDCNPVGYPS